jgi:hypothetical protein
MTSELAAIMFSLGIACPYFTGGGTGRIFLFIFGFLHFGTKLNPV